MQDAIDTFGAINKIGITISSQLLEEHGNFIIPSGPINEDLLELTYNKLKKLEENDDIYLYEQLFYITITVLNTDALKKKKKDK